MALVYDVKLQPDDAGGYAKGAQQDSLQTTFTQTYSVEVSDDAGTIDPRDVSAFDVLGAPGLPLVNFSTYVTPLGQIIPYLVCRDKQASRDEQRRSRWLVRTRWDTGDRANQQEQNQRPQAPPVNLTDFAPKIETALGDDERVRYSDKDNKDCLTPTGNMFDSPFVELVPTEIRRVTQYEPSITYATMRARKFKTNSDGYRGEAVGAWFMTQVEATEVEVVLSTGPVTAAQVTYTMELTDRPGLWKEQRALIDTHYKDDGNNDLKTPFVDETLQRYTVGRVDLQGRRNEVGQDMEYDNWRMQDEQDFGSFLQA